MHVHDLMTKDAIVADLDTPLSDILSLMQRRGIHQVPVIAQLDKHHKSGDVSGMVTLNKIVTREFDLVKTTAKAVISSTAKVAPDATLDRAAELIVNSNQRALPVWDNGIVGMISEYDLVKALIVEGRAEDLAKPFLAVDDKAGIGKAKEIMVQKNVSRVGVVRAGRATDVVGVIGTLDLAKALAPGTKTPHGGASVVRFGKAGAETRSQRDRGYMETSQLDSVSVMNFVHQAPFVDGDTDLRKVAELLSNNDEVVVKLSDGLGIITPKDLLRAYLSKRSVELVQIVGLDREDNILDVARVQQKAAQIIEHLARFAELQPMKIYIKKHKKQGPKVKYSVKIEFPTSIGVLIANCEHGEKDKSYDQLTTVVQRALDDIERMARKAQEKFHKPDRAWVSEMRSEKEEGIGLRTRKIKKGSAMRRD